MGIIRWQLCFFIFVVVALNLELRLIKLRSFFIIVSKLYLLVAWILMDQVISNHFSYGIHKPWRFGWDCENHSHPWYQCLPNSRIAVPKSSTLSLKLSFDPNKLVALPVNMLWSSITFSSICNTKRSNFKLYPWSHLNLPNMTHLDPIDEKKLHRWGLSSNK